MSTTVEVFVASACSFADFVRDVQVLLGIPFGYAADSRGDADFDRYEAVTPSAAITILRVDGLEGDEYINVQDYDYYFSLLGIGKPFDAGLRARDRDDFAHLVFQTLKATQRYRIMLVYNMRTKLDEFPPQPLEDNTN